MQVKEKPIAYIWLGPLVWIFFPCPLSRQHCPFYYQQWALRGWSGNLWKWDGVTCTCGITGNHSFQHRDPSSDDSLCPAGSQDNIHLSGGHWPLSSASDTFRSSPLTLLCTSDLEEGVSVLLTCGMILFVSLLQDLLWWGAKLSALRYESEPWGCLFLWLLKALQTASARLKCPKTVEGFGSPKLSVSES